MCQTKNITALIKTFRRPKSLQLLLESIRQFFPDLRVVIVDDSPIPLNDTNLGNHVQYIHTDYDIGLSAGRNFGLDFIQTKYVLLLDDDFLFTPRTQIGKMYDVLEKTDFSLVGGTLLDYGYVSRRFHGCFGEKDGVLQLNIETNKGFAFGYPLYDFVLNFFMGKTSHIKQVLWDEDLKLGEHEDFFLRFVQKGYKVTALPSVVAEHYPVVDGKYKGNRDRIDQFQNLFFAKSGFREIQFIRKTPWYYPGLKSIITSPINTIKNIDSYWNFLSSFFRRAKIKKFLLKNSA